MVPKLHAKGKSFKGAAAYLLHDKDRAESADRVAWTDTINLATDNPESAWRVMAATALKQNELKESAGVQKRGRKSADAVLHMTLAWHPDQKSDASRDEMLRAATGALTALHANDHQALVVCHSDERQPHIHVLVNRVHPETGRMLPSSNEKLNLSKWAEAYEQQQGKVYCEQRILNNDARRRDKYTRGKKDKSRHIYEAIEQAKPSDQAKTEQRLKDAAVAQKTRETRARQKKQWSDLRAEHRQNVQDIKVKAERGLQERIGIIREQFRPRYQTILQDHQTRMRSFIENEKTTLGRVYNALKAVNLRAIIRGEDAGPDARTRRGALDAAFNALSSAGARKLELERRYEREKANLSRLENRAERDEAQKTRSAKTELLKTARLRFEQQRADLVLTQKLEGAKIRTDWKTRGEQRDKAWANGRSNPSGRTQDHDADLAERLRKIDEYRQRLKTQKDREQDRDR